MWMLFAAPAAHAGLYKVDFHFQDFVSSSGAVVPQARVDGSLTYASLSAYDAVSSIESIALTIGTHNYTLDEVGFYPLIQRPFFGATISGVNVVQGSTQDFSFSVFRPELNRVRFVYAVPDKTGNFFASETGTVVVSDLGTVPEPGTSALLGLAGVLAFLAQTRKKTIFKSK